MIALVLISSEAFGAGALTRVTTTGGVVTTWLMTNGVGACDVEGVEVRAECEAVSAMLLATSFCHDSIFRSSEMQSTMAAASSFPS